MRYGIVFSRDEFVDEYMSILRVLPKQMLREISLDSVMNGALRNLILRKLPNNAIYRIFGIKWEVRGKTVVVIYGKSAM